MKIPTIREDNGCKCMTCLMVQLDKDEKAAREAAQKKGK